MTETTMISKSTDQPADEDPVWPEPGTTFLAERCVCLKAQVRLTKNPCK